MEVEDLRSVLRIDREGDTGRGRVSLNQFRRPAGPPARPHWSSARPARQEIAEFGHQRNRDWLARDFAVLRESAVEVDGRGRGVEVEALRCERGQFSDAIARIRRDSVEHRTFGAGQPLEDSACPCRHDQLRKFIRREDPADVSAIPLGVPFLHRSEWIAFEPLVLHHPVTELRNGLHVVVRRLNAQLPLSGAE
ncbi:MAG: hypothetical protein U0791_10910 [Gemmataceae bacterium]